MQQDDAPGFGPLVARAIGTALIRTGRVSPVAGVVRSGTRNFLRHGYFGDSGIDLTSEYGGASIGEIFEREHSTAMKRCPWRDDEIHGGAGRNGDAEEPDFEALLNALTPGNWSR